MINRRDAISLLGTLSAGLWLGNRPGDILSRPASPSTASGLQDAQDPPLAPGAPMSPERRALVDAFNAKAEGIGKLFEARTHEADWTMPYRLFRPKAPGKLPLVMYLHGSGGLGTDNEKQMGLGNTFGTRVWALPENQKRFPAYVVAPQTDRGWARYEVPSPADSVAQLVPGLGDGARLAIAIIEELIAKFPIDPQRVYITGQSMGGAGVWHMTAQRPKLFAGAVACCGSRTEEPATASAGIPFWNFHGAADQTVSPTVSRERVAALRKAGGHPIATEYAGVGHNVWEWAYTEPALLPWLFSKRRKG